MLSGEISEPGDYEDETLPLAEFDYLSIHAIVHEPEKKHPAFGLPYSKFKEYRQRTHNGDDDKRTGRVKFWCDPALAGFLPTLARRRSMTTNSYIIDMLEEGQIHFHPEYHERYAEINEIMDDMNDNVHCEEQEEIMRSMRCQTVDIESCSRKNPSFSPYTPEWLSQDIKSVAMNIHASKSDTALIYIITGILYSDATEIPINPYFSDKMSKIVDLFSKRLDAMLEMCRYTKERFDGLSTKYQ